MNPTDIKNKLTNAGVPAAIVDKLETALGDKLEGELISGGLKAAAAKVGIDTTDLPDIDFKNALEAVEEATGMDMNRDGKVGDGDNNTGLTEVVENAKEAIANTDIAEVKEFAQKQGTGILAKIKSFFGSSQA
jgi:hypothetical protein